ncbi:hypothetical protein F5B22DRAFT_313422 [Xylaria bambusicola]|uniref:uncharacterized protein n=1 Tax=Xylaria bambusicola TaxID=326684 RepID=UPI002008A3B4|nr:uncharacterized protein F5B22DRAFT_313422 [Xylaria bambusicola]KAI0509730.1 hypothetical protein F5B22DRAFT_313422 [Xylaria bambusicola]
MPPKRGSEPTSLDDLEKPEKKAKHENLTLEAELSELAALSDVVVRCGSKEWNLHGAVLARGSQWFKRALLCCFKEGKTRVINIEGWNEEQVGIVIECIYSDGANWQKFRKSQTFTGHCMDVLDLADYFLIPELGESSEKAFTRMVFSMLVHFQRPRQHQEEQDKQDNRETEEFLAIVKEVNLHDDSPSRRAFQPTALTALHSAQYRLTEGILAAFIDEMPLVAIDLLKFGLTKRSPRTYPDRCDICCKSVEQIGLGFSIVALELVYGSLKLKGVCCRCDKNCQMYGVSDD